MAALDIARRYHLSRTSSLTTKRVQRSTLKDACASCKFTRASQQNKNAINIMIVEANKFIPCRWVYWPSSHHHTVPLKLHAKVKCLDLPCVQAPAWICEKKKRRPMRPSKFELSPCRLSGDVGLTAKPCNGFTLSRPSLLVCERCFFFFKKKIRCPPPISPLVWSLAP